MADIFKYVAFVFGSVILLQVALVGTPFRHKKPFSCAACLGFWLGLVCCDGFFKLDPWLTTHGIMDRVEWATIASGVCWFLNSVVTKET